MVSGVWLVNGVDLDAVAWSIETTDGLQVTPKWLADDLEVAGWHGSLDVHGEAGQQRRPFKSGRWKASMWVLGVDPSTGANLPQGPGLAAYMARVDELARLFHSRSLTIAHVRPDGTTRQAVGHLAAEPLDFTLSPGSPWFGRFVVDVVLPDPFWYEAAATTVSATLATGGVLDLSVFAKATAPMRAVDLRFGPGNNPSLSHAGGFFAWDGVIAAGNELLAKCDPRDPTLGAGTGGAWSPAYSGIRYGPGPSWFELDPRVSTAALSHSGGGSMSVSVSARIAHLTS